MSNEQDKLLAAKAAIESLIELQDEVVELLTMIYLFQHGHVSDDKPCPDSKLHQIGQYVFGEMLNLSLLANVIQGRMMMHFEDGAEEPTFSITEKGLSSLVTDSENKTARA